MSALLVFGIGDWAAVAPLAGAVIAHRPSALAAVDVIAVVGNGQLTAFGPKDEVLRKVLKPVAATGS